VTGSGPPRAARSRTAGCGREGLFQTLWHTRMMLPKGRVKPCSSCCESRPRSRHLSRGLRPKAPLLALLSPILSDMSRLRSTALCLAPGRSTGLPRRAGRVGGAAAVGRKIPCRSCIAMVPCALLIENRGGGYQLRPLEESTSCDSRDNVLLSTSPFLEMVVDERM